MVLLLQMKLKSSFLYRDNPSKNPHHSTRLLIELFSTKIQKEEGVKGTHWYSNMVEHKPMLQKTYHHPGTSGPIPQVLAWSLQE